MPPLTAGCTAFRHACLERPPGRHVGGCAGAWAQGGRLPRQASCRGRGLVAPGSLSLVGPCRDAWCVAASSLLCLGWPSRQAPLAGVLSPWLGYFVLEWLQRNHGGPWRSPGKPCRGMLRLPVHKFGILGYPYSRTPTTTIRSYRCVCERGQVHACTSSQSTSVCGWHRPREQ